MAEIILGALDIGTQSTSLVAAEYKNQQLAILYHVCVPTTSVKKGTIRDIENVVVCVKHACKKMHELYNVELYDLLTSFSCAGIETQIHTGRKSLLHGHIIDEDDVQEAEDNAETAPSADATMETIHRFRQNYGVNGQPVNTPYGMTGTELTANILEMTAPKSSLNSLNAVMHRAGLRIQEVVFSGLASAEAVLDNQQREEGAIVIDIGAGTTDYIAFCNGVVAAAGTLGIGGAHLTNDLATAFQISQQQAEEVKLARGAATIQSDLAKERFNLHNTFSTGERSISVHAIQTVTTERIDELLRLIRDLLVEKDVLTHIHGKLYITGGTAALPLITEKAKSVFGLPCVLGQPVDVVRMPEEMMDAPYRFASQIGMLKWRVRQLANEVHKPSTWSRIKHFLKG